MIYNSFILSSKMQQIKYFFIIIIFVITINLSTSLTFSIDVQRNKLRSLTNPTPLDPISTDPPPPIFPTQEHSQLPYNIDDGSKSKPIETNKWYVNMMLDKGQNPIWPLPYGLRWENNQAGQTNGFFGLSISHVDDDEKVLFYGAIFFS